jgi:Lon protease-like protein
MPHLPRTLNAVPVFPLPDYYLFPGVVAPLHVFETRYRQMMDDLMDGPGRLVMTPFRTDTPRSERGPELADVGTLAEIVQHEQLADGRWVMIVAALGRVRIAEVESDRLYRKVDAVLVPDADPGDAEAEDLRSRIVAALHERADGPWEAPAGTSTGRLADLLLHALALDAERQALAYAETDPLARAELALLWHDQQPQQSEGEA